VDFFEGLFLVRFLGTLASGQEAAGLLDELRRAGEAAGAERPLLPPGTEFSGGGGGCLSEAAALLRPCEGCSERADDVEEDAAPPEEHLAADPPLLHALLGCSAIESRLAPAINTLGLQSENKKYQLNFQGKNT